jgi:hypothetical protein
MLEDVRQPARLLTTPVSRPGKYGIRPGPGPQEVADQNHLIVISLLGALASSQGLTRLAPAYVEALADWLQSIRVPGTRIAGAARVLTSDPARTPRLKPPGTWGLLTRDPGACKLSARG